MEYTDRRGNAATGEVWSPGPLPNTVWVLPYSGAPSSVARVVHVRKRVEIPRNDGTWLHGADSPFPGSQAVYLSEAHYAAKLPNTLWHAALGYDPRDVVRNGGTLPLPIAA